MVPKVPVFNCTPPPISKLAHVNKATVSLANWMWTTVPQHCLLQVEGMECSQYTAQSKQSVSEKILTTEHLYTTFLQDNIDHQCSTPWEREGFSKTDSTQYCNSRNTQNREEAQLVAAPPMHKIQQNGSIRDYSNTQTRTRNETEDKKNRTSRRMKQEETQKWSKLFYSKSSTLYFAFINIVLEFHKLITALPNSKLRMHLKQDLVLT